MWRGQVIVGIAVAAKDFVCAFAGQRYCYVAARFATKPEEWQHRLISDRFVQRGRDLWQQRAKRFFIKHEMVMIASDLVGYQSRVLAFVVARQSKAHRKRGNARMFCGRDGGEH